jgi:DNA integrity scanning protein DisA with diadenylate cyclase activity
MNNDKNKLNRAFAISIINTIIFMIIMFFIAYTLHETLEHPVITAIVYFLVMYIGQFGRYSMLKKTVDKYGYV